MKDRPDSPGMYWARTSEDYRWYNLIVEVGGKPPWLEICNVFSRGIGVSDDGIDVVYGPKIEIPEIVDKSKE